MIQWHLLMEQLQQSDEAYESLAGDMADMGTQAEQPNAAMTRSGMALKALHKKIGNQGFQQFVEMKQAKVLSQSGAKSTTKSAAQEQGGNKTLAAIKSELNTAPVVQDKTDTASAELCQSKEDANTAQSKKTPAPADDKQSSLPSSFSTTKDEPIPATDAKEAAKSDELTQALKAKQKSKKENKVSNKHRQPQPSEKVLAQLLQTFKQSLPAPSNKLWRSLEAHYLLLQSKQQAKIVAALTLMLRQLSAKQKTLFFDSIQGQLSLHIVQAILHKFAPQTSPGVMVEESAPVDPEED